MFSFSKNKHCATSGKSSELTAASEDSRITDNAMPNDSVTKKRKNSGLDESENVAKSLNKSLSFIESDNDSDSSKPSTASKTEITVKNIILII